MRYKSLNMLSNNKLNIYFGVNKFKFIKSIFISEIIFILTLFLSLNLTGCANLVPENINISQDRLQKKLSEHFPKSKNLLSFYQITVSNPKLFLEPTTNRVKISANTQINSSISETLYGNITFSSNLILDDKKEYLLLKNPTVDEFNLKNKNELAINNVITPILKLGVSDILDLYPIYKIKPDELTFLGVNLQPVDINVQKNGINIKVQAKNQ